LAFDTSHFEISALLERASLAPMKLFFALVAMNVKDQFIWAKERRCASYNKGEINVSIYVN
jgi:hypothetical protein